jgi:hypothetical protein
MEGSVADAIYARFFAELDKVDGWGPTVAEVLRQLHDEGPRGYPDDVLHELYRRVAAGTPWAPS